MRTTRWVLAVLVGMLFASAHADPPDAAADERELVRAYQAKDYPAVLRAAQRVLANDPSLPRSIYNVAAGQALTGVAGDAVKTLQRLAAMGLGFAVEKDDDFRALHDRPDFQALVAALRKNKLPRGTAEPTFTVAGELLTEGIAHDPATKTFFVSSVRHRKIIAIDARGQQRDFIAEAQDGIGGVFGMAVDRAHGTLWAASTALPHMIGFRPEDKDVSGLYALDLATGALRAKYLLPHDGKPHALGDVIVSSRGDAYATDSASPALYRVAAGKPALEVVLDGSFPSLQGLALSADEKTLYFADYSCGLYALRLADKALTHLRPEATIAVTGIDGLYVHRGRLLATQNGTSPRRVLELAIDPTGARITSQQILLSGDPRTDDLSLGVIVGDAFYLNAAAGWAHYTDDGKPNDQPAAPHAILKLALPR